jgi:hypothetical protein
MNTHTYGLRFLLIGFMASFLGLFLLPWIVSPSKALEFNPKLGGRTIDLPAEAYWTLSGHDTDYKNAILKDFQDMLSGAGIPRKEQRWYAAQLCQENCAFDSTRLGDWECYDRNRGRLQGGHCSFGLIQYNSWSHNGLSAEQFLKQNPEWKSYKFQLGLMRDMILERRKLYSGNIRRVVLHHNLPACARNHECFDTKAGYYVQISQKLSLLTASAL